MRDLILNHVSCVANSKQAAIEVLKELSAGAAILVSANIARAVLRSKYSMYELKCGEGFTLLDAIHGLREVGALDQFRFFVRLVTKFPLIADLDAAAVDRFRACEAHKLAPADGEPLLLCAHLKFVSVSFPTEMRWDNDELEVEFIELLANGEIENVTEKIDNLARDVHATAILNRAQRVAVSEATAQGLWRDRERVFPLLRFGPGVEDDLTNLLPSLFPTVLGRLQELHSTAQEWRARGGPAPPWHCKVTPESDRVMNNDALREARRFPSVEGNRQLFFWHARYGSSGRIHLRFNAAVRSIEIGYLGGHLPL
jgi:hypothetical protein